jgi:hypothetical protein
MRRPRWSHLLAALLALGGGTGCPDEPIPCVPGPGSVGQRQGVPVFGVGTEARFDVVADLSRACDTPNTPRSPESVTVEVKDPENHPVPATAELLGDGRTATIRFTPTVLGRHHVIVAFAPVGSLHQLGVFAGEDRRKEAALVKLPTGEPCPSLDRTARGTWLCGSQALREPSDKPQALTTVKPAGPSLVAGDVVWTLDGDRVLRYVDTGTGPLQLTGTAPYPPGATPGSLPPLPHSRLATVDELVVLSDAHLHRYTFTEADGLATAPTAVWVPQQASSFGGDSVFGLLVRAGERVLLVTRLMDSRTFEVETRVCPFQPGEGGALGPVRGEPCHALTGEPVGHEEGVVWTRTFDTSGTFPREALRRYAVSGGALVEEGQLPLDGQLNTGPTLLRQGPVVPVLTTLGAFEPVVGPRWDAERGRLELVLLPRPLGSTVPRLGQHFFWLENSTSPGEATWVYPRQSTR